LKAVPAVEHTGVCAFDLRQPNFKGFRDCGGCFDDGKSADALWITAVSPGFFISLFGDPTRGLSLVTTVYPRDMVWDKQCVTANQRQ
jgi:hypothetical protein